MEITLLAVTVVSLVVAFIMSVAAWRLARDERSRRAARVALLSAAAGAPDSPARATGHAATDSETATERMAVGEARVPAPWASARISAFASGRAAALRQPEARTAIAADDLPLTTTLVDGFLAGSVSASPSGQGQRRLAIAAMILFAAIAVGGYWTFYGSRSWGVNAAAIAVDRSPLELVSLRHERRGSRLALTGLVRNPVAGSQVNKLSAVALLFDQQGAFITSARAEVDFLSLAPGDESPFVISVEAPATVTRYRVSFRNDAGIVAHIDRRGQEPIAPNAERGAGVQ